MCAGAVLSPLYAWSESILTQPYKVSSIITVILEWRQLRAKTVQLITDKPDIWTKTTRLWSLSSQPLNYITSHSQSPDARSPSFSSVTLRNPWVTNRGYLVLGLLEIPRCLSVQWLGLGHLQPSFKMDNLNKAYIREELCWGHFTVSLEFQYPPNIIL